MKILVYSTQYMPTGGIESHLREFCANVSAQGVAIDLVILNSRMLPETKIFFSQVCRHVYLCEQGRSISRIVWLVTVCLRLLANRYDALYTNGQGNSIRLIARLTRFFNWVHHHHTAGDKADQQGWSQEYIEALHKANHIIACSQKNAGDMTPFLQRNVETIPCFSRQMSPAQVSGKPKDKVRFGYFGRLIPEKGIDIICRMSADSRFTGIEFQLWGEGEQYSSHYFTNYPNIRYHGAYQGREGLQKAIDSMDAFLLLSSHAEGLPVSLLEAMSAGLPWLATCRGGIPDIACDPDATRVIPADSSYSDMEEAVLLFVKDIQEGKVSPEKQMQQYQDFFSPAALTKRWLAVLGKK